MKTKYKNMTYTKYSYSCKRGDYLSFALLFETEAKRSWLLFGVNMPNKDTVNVSYVQHKGQVLLDFKESEDVYKYYENEIIEISKQIYSQYFKLGE